MTTSFVNYMYKKSRNAAQHCINLKSWHLSQQIKDAPKKFMGDDEQGINNVTLTQDMVKCKINKLKEDKTAESDAATPTFLSVLNVWPEKLCFLFHLFFSASKMPVSFLKCFR